MHCVNKCIHKDNITNTCVCVFQETAQRERLLSTLQEDRDRLQASHAVQLEKLRLQLDTQIQKAQLTHSRKVGWDRHTLLQTMQCCTFGNITLHKTDGSEGILTTWYHTWF